MVRVMDLADRMAGQVRVPGPAQAARFMAVVLAPPEHEEHGRVQGFFGRRLDSGLDARPELVARAL